MDKKQLLEGINSNYLLNQIFYYIQDENIKLKLFFHSKSFQEKLGIKPIDYKEGFLKKIKFNLDTYLYKNIENDKETLNKSLQRFLKKKKLNKKEIEKIVYDIYSNKKVKDIEEEDINMIDENYYKLINVFSPFFDILSRTDIFEKKYCIPIIEQSIEKYQLNNDYKNIFEQLNESNIKYTSLLLLFIDNNKINYLKDFNIDFNRIKSLSIVQDGIVNKNDKYLLNTLFSFKNIENNLVYLKIYLTKEKKCKTDTDSFENINNFKSIKYLYLSSLCFDKPFLLKLKNLKLLSIEVCENIGLSEDCCSNIQRIRLAETKLYLNNEDKLFKTIKLPKIEFCDFYDYNMDYNSIFDLKNLKCLKNFIGKSIDFLQLESESLQIIGFISYFKNESKDIEFKIIEKVLGLKKLNHLELSIFKINDNDIAAIHGENISLNNLFINWRNDIEKCILINLEKKFPNLSKIKIIIPNEDEDEDEDEDSSYNFKPSIININENKNSKINKIYLDINKPNDLIQLDCGAFEKLVEILLIIQPCIKNLEACFPILGKNCQIIFKSLKVFYFKYEYLSIFDNTIQNILENIYNNFEKMPNLKEFYLVCTCQISEEFYKKFLTKILSSNLNSICFDMKNNEKYSKSMLKETEIKNIYQNFDRYQYQYIYINKF